MLNSFQLKISLSECVKSELLIMPNQCPTSRASCSLCSDLLRAHWTSCMATAMLFSYLVHTVSPINISLFYKRIHLFCWKKWTFIILIFWIWEKLSVANGAQFLNIAGKSLGCKKRKRQNFIPVETNKKTRITNPIPFCPFTWSDLKKQQDGERVKFHLPISLFKLNWHPNCHQ